MNPFHEKQKNNNNFFLTFWYSQTGVKSVLLFEDIDDEKLIDLSCNRHKINTFNVIEIQPTFVITQLNFESLAIKPNQQINN